MKNLFLVCLAFMAILLTGCQTSPYSPRGERHFIIKNLTFGDLGVMFGGVQTESISRDESRIFVQNDQFDHSLEIRLQRDDGKILTLKYDPIPFPDDWDLAYTIRIKVFYTDDFK